MSNRDSKRLGMFISPNDASLPAVPESPTVSSTMEAQQQQQHQQQHAQPNNTGGPQASSSQFRPRAQSSSFGNRPRKPSSRRQAPDGLQFEANKLGVPRKPNGDFPSPGRAPRGQRIFDASAFAEKKGVETAEPGWAVNPKMQAKLEDDSYRHEHPEEFDTVGQKISRSLSTVKRSASMSVKRARSLRRPRGNSSSQGQGDYEPMPPPPFEDADAKMVRMSVVKPHDD